MENYSTPNNMDHLDLRIIDVLQKEGNLTNADLAERVGSTASTCLRRVGELRRQGVLTDNVYLVDASKLGRGLKAIITVTTKDHPKTERRKFASKLRKEAAITHAYGVTGDVDAVLIGNFQDMVEYQDLCDRLFDRIDSVERYTTCFVSETYKAHSRISTKPAKN